MQNVALIEITVTEHNFLTDFSSNLSFLYFALLRGLKVLHLWSDACILFFLLIDLLVTCISKQSLICLFST